MKSGWFWGTAMWADYLQEYVKIRPECIDEFKSSPLADDHDFSDTGEQYSFSTHQTQVIDLRTHKWSDVRKSYRSIIHRANKDYDIVRCSTITPFMLAHISAFGTTRGIETFKVQERWMDAGHAMAICAYPVLSTLRPSPQTAALWIVYQGKAYYASGPSKDLNVQHAIMWQSLCWLKLEGITLAEIGVVDGETDKEKNIGFFKTGFGGEAKPFTIARKIKHPGRAL
jgi:hypothetical protein